MNRIFCMKQFVLLAIVGPPAAGKTTLLNNLLRLGPHIMAVKRYTTRPRRPNEKKDSLEYEFVSKKKFTTLEEKGFFIPESIDRAIEENGKFYSAGISKVDHWPKPTKKTRLVILLPGRRAFLMKEYLPQMRLVFFSTLLVELMLRVSKRYRRRGLPWHRKIEKIKCYLGDHLEERCDFTVDSGETPEDCVIEFLRIARQIVQESRPTL